MSHMYLIILKKRSHARKSKYNLKRESQVILLIITDGEKWHYLAVKKLSALFSGNAQSKQQNTKIPPWRKVYENSIYYLCRRRVFT